MSDERLEIPHPAGAPNIVGILHRTPSAANSSTSSPSKPLVLIIHGQLAHKNQSYHRRLASSLSEERGWSSYRYDLRGQGGETEAITEWTSAGYEADVDDLQLVVDWFVNEGYTITLSELPLPLPLHSSLTLSNPKSTFKLSGTQEVRTISPDPHQDAKLTCT